MRINKQEQTNMGGRFGNEKRVGLDSPGPWCDVCDSDIRRDKT